MSDKNKNEGLDYIDLLWLTYNFGDDDSVNSGWGFDKFGTAKFGTSGITKSELPRGYMTLKKFW
jgi:hypothetical protein